MEDILEVGKNCLLGELLVHKAVNVEAMMNVLLKIWKISTGLSIREVGERLFIFHFVDPRNKERVIQRQPWF